MTTLYSDLQTGYNMYVRPAVDQNSPVVVNVTFNLVGIKDFDEVTGKFSVTGYFYITWMEPRFSWNPFLYNETYTISFPQKQVWKPEITMVNPYDSIKSMGKDFIVINYIYNGFAYWTPGDIMDSLCSVNVKYYPFDTQTCYFNMLVWGTLSSQIYLQPGTADVGMDYFEEHGTWKLVNAKTEGVYEGGLSMITVTMVVSRRPLFALVNVILPITFMSVLNLLVFYLPVESGERVSYAITVLLAIAVFLTLVGDNLPKTSEPMSIICYFLMIDLVLSAIICFVAIIGLSLHFRNESEHPVPSPLAKFVRCFNSGCCKKKTGDVVDFNNVSVVDAGEPKKKKMAFADDEFMPIKWKMVTKSLDKLWFLLGGIWTIICFVVFFVITIASLG